MSVADASAPEQGQLVQVRSRRWVVNEVKPSGLPAPAMELPVARRQHLLTLASVEDDGLGEELQVVWEVEPGARVIEKVSLPEGTGLDVPGTLDAFLDAVRWGAASTADHKNIQSPFRSGIEIEDYQLDPVVRGDPDAEGQPADRRRRGTGQDHRGGDGRPGADYPPPGQEDPGRLPVRPPDPVAGPDAGQVRAGLPDRGLGPDA